MALARGCLAIVDVVDGKIVNKRDFSDFQFWHIVFC